MLRTLFVAGAVLAGCGGGRDAAAPRPVVDVTPPVDAAPARPPTYERVWTYDPPVYISERALSESFFSPELVLFHNRDTLGGQLVALVPSTGAVAWERSANHAAHPPDRAEPLWIVDAPPVRSFKELIRLDPRTGAELARVRLDPPLDGVDVRFVWARDMILAYAYDKLRALDPDTGATRWTAPLPPNAHLRAPAIIGDTIVVADKTYRAFDLRTGAARWQFEGACCKALASPDGKTLYVRGKTTGVRLDAEGRVVAELPGEALAVSNRYVALDEGKRAAVYRHGEARAVWEHPRAGEVFTSAVALHGDVLFYFSSVDNKLWRLDLATNAKSEVMAAHARYVHSPDARGVAPAYLGTPPAYAPPYVFVHNWGIEAYRER